MEIRTAAIASDTPIKMTWSKSSVMVRIVSLFTLSLIKVQALIPTCDESKVRAIF